MLVSHPSREVIKAALAFVKVAVVVLHREQLQVSQSRSSLTETPSISLFPLARSPLRSVPSRPLASPRLASPLLRNLA